MSQVSLGSQVPVNQNNQDRSADRASSGLRVTYSPAERIGVYGLSVAGTAVGLTTAALGFGAAALGTISMLGFGEAPVSVYGDDGQIDGYDRIIGTTMYASGTIMTLVASKIVASSISLATSMMRESSEPIKKD